MADARKIDPSKNERSRLADAYEAGRRAYRASTEFPPDPAGEDGEYERHRSLGKWRFILVRGVIGFGVPMFLWLVISDLKDSFQHSPLKVSFLRTILEKSLFAFGISVLMAAFVGFLAWRRVTSDYWPKTKSDPESTLTRMDPL